MLNKSLVPPFQIAQKLLKFFDLFMILLRFAFLIKDRATACKSYRTRGGFFRSLFHRGTFILHSNLFVKDDDFQICADDCLRASCECE